MGAYDQFLLTKSQLDGEYGFDPVWMPDFLIDFQSAMVEWACRKGRAALFEDCGLGKTVQELTWGENVVRMTNGRVLLAAPARSGSIEELPEGAFKSSGTMVRTVIVTIPA